MMKMSKTCCETSFPYDSPNIFNAKAWHPKMMNVTTSHVMTFDKRFCGKQPMYTIRPEWMKPKLISARPKSIYCGEPFEPIVSSTS